MSVGLTLGAATSLFQITQGVLETGAASVNDIVDVSFQLYKDITIPFNSEPSLEELPAFLLTDPLAQFPVHPSVFNLLENLILIHTVRRLFRSSTFEYCDIYGNLINLAQMKVKLDSDGECMLHYYVDSLIKEVFQKILSFSGLITHTS